MGLIRLVLLTNILSIILSFAKPASIVIPRGEIPKHLVTVPRSKKNDTNIKYCPMVYRNMTTILPFKNQVSYMELVSFVSHTDIKPGGAWSPKDCKPVHKVAIIVPYRNREEHLKVFLLYMHQFLRNQMLNYRIIIVEQTIGGEFNKGKLFNIGFTEVLKIDDFPCFIFHDVDLIPQSLNNIYGCTKLPRHMSSKIDKFYYTLPSDDMFGGAIALLKEQFIKANGFSNKFLGWGGEDDDFYNRITRDGKKICRYSSDVSRYIMLPHPQATPNSQRYSLIRNGTHSYDTDGLNSLTYNVLQMVMNPLYTRLLVAV